MSKNNWFRPDSWHKVAEELSKANLTEWFTLSSLSDRMGVSDVSIKPVVYELAGAGMLDIQDGWTAKENMRFRLRSEYRDKKPR